MYERFTDRARKVMQLANQEALRFNHEYIGTEHIVLGLVKEGSGVAANVLKNLDIDLLKIRREVEKIVQAGPDTVTLRKLPQTPRAKKVIEHAIEEARNLNHNYVGTEHLLLGLLREEEGVASQVLMNLGLILADAREELIKLLAPNLGSGESNIGELVAAKAKSKIPAPDYFGRDLTELARLSQLDPVFGHHKEIDRVIAVLARRTRNNPVLVGETGTTAVLRGLAQRIAVDSDCRLLRDRRLVGLDWAKLVVGVRNRRSFEERIQAAVQGVCRAGDVILFIDDLRILVGSPSLLFSRTASNHLKSALVRGELQCIATATPEQYRQYLCGEPVLTRYLQTVTVEPSTPEDTFEILCDLRGRYEEHHRALILDEALIAAVELGTRFLPDQFLPEKAVDLIDEAGAILQLRLGHLLYQEEEAIDQQIEELNQSKEERVAEHDFEGAAHDRDQCDKLKKKREKLRREWQGRDWRPTAKAVGLVVDSNTVIEALSAITGIGVEELRNRDTWPKG